jgi:hypothetical protein
MNLRAKRTGLFLFVGICAFLLFHCSPTRLGMDGGPTTQTGNGMIAGILYQSDGKTPAGDAYVSLRKKNAVAADFTDVLMKKFTDTSAATRTDSKGEFKIDSVDTGFYVLECTDGGNNFALNDSVPVHYFDSTVILPPAVLKPAGAIKGMIRLSEGGDPRKVFILALGTERFTPVEASGRFKFMRLAEGNYTLRIFPTLDNYAVFDTANIPVKSKDTTDIGVITPFFTDIPTIKNLTIFYDTLQQRVTLRWSKPVSTIVKSFNLYRRAIDPISAKYGEFYFSTIFDTVFTDSICEQNKTYEYRITAVDSSAKEGGISAPVKAHIALYNITPKNVAMTYDTIKQTIMVRWSNPDSARIKSYNIYRRNVDLNETFWTPFNNGQIHDTSFIDSTFNICPNYTFTSSGSMDNKEPMYEYCIGALIDNICEGVRSIGVSARISFKYIAPNNVQCAYDTLLRRVKLSWSIPDTTLVKSFNIFRKNLDQSNQGFSQINDAALVDTVFIDSTCRQNKTYEYRIASIVDSRAEVKSEGMRIRITVGE